MSDPLNNLLRDLDIDWPAARSAFEQSAVEFVTKMVENPPRDHGMKQEFAGDMTYRILRAAFGKHKV